MAPAEAPPVAIFLHSLQAIWRHGETDTGKGQDKQKTPDLEIKNHQVTDMENEKWIEMIWNDLNPKTLQIT